jgi:L-glyceraldehyde 3-phosphate reductase
MLSARYLGGVPEDARAARGGSFSQKLLTPDNIERLRGLDAIARRRGQSLAQMAIAWVLRDPRVTSALIGARTVAQLDESLDGSSGSTSRDRAGRDRTVFSPPYGRRRPVCGSPS